MLHLNAKWRPVVRVLRCPPFDNVQLGGGEHNFTSPRAQSALRYSHVSLDALVGKALLLRYGQQLPFDAVDLEYVPLVCFGRRKTVTSSSSRPSIGRFTILATAWTLGEGIQLRLRKRLCVTDNGPDSHHGVPTDDLPFAILSTEAPAVWPQWNGTTADAWLPMQSTPPLGHAALQVLQVPYPTTEYWNGTSYPLVPPLAARSALVALIASVYGREKNGRAFPIGGPLRRLLHEECVRAPPGQCLMPMTADNAPTIRVMREKGGHTPFGEPSELYRRARFCLQPWGDTGGRKGYFDAIMAGCINVIFTRAPWNRMDSWFVRHTDVSVLVPLSVFLPGGRGVLAYLNSLGEPAVRRLHHNVMRARGRVQYSPFNNTPGGGDALDATVHAVATVLTEVRASLGGHLGPGRAQQVAEEYICGKCDALLFGRRCDLETTNETVPVHHTSNDKV